MSKLEPTDDEVRIELDLGMHLIIETPQGLVYVSTLMGTSVTVYDHPEENPVATVFLR